VCSLEEEKEATRLEGQEGGREGNVEVVTEVEESELGVLKLLQDDFGRRMPVVL